MNSFTLLAEIVSDPELRYTSDNQNSIASFLVKFSGPREEDAPSQLKVVGWNRLADEIMEKHHKGDVVLLEGRLAMNLVDRGGYKEKRAEMTALRIHPLGGAGVGGAGVGGAGVVSASSSATTSTTSRSSKSKASSASVTASVASVPKATPASDEPEYDNIPF